MAFFILQSLVSIAYLGFVKPFTIELDNLVEGVNEIIILLLGLRIITLFDDSMDFGTRVEYGIFSISFISLLILINCIRWIFGLYLTIKLKYQRKKQQSEIKVEEAEVELSGRKQV